MVLGSGKTELIPYAAVLEYIDGVSVNVLQESGKMTEDLAHYIYRSVFKTLKELKTKEVAHRDMKPENIMVDLHNGNVKVIDFGISKKVKPGETETFDKCGTRKYWAWEQVSSKEVIYDPYKVDVFSACMSVMETLHGFYPLKLNENVKIFDPKNEIWHMARKQEWDGVFKLFERHSYEESISENLKSFISSCLAKKE